MPPVVKNNRLRLIVRALRLHQWAKNFLIFIPMIMAHRFSETWVVQSTLLAFASFGLLASATYLINDLFDLQADRAHPRKARRPFASGDLSPRWGFFLIPVLLLLCLLCAWPLPITFLWVLLFYLVSTLAYSSYVKHIPLVDVLVLAGLYSVRILAGSKATDTPISPWLLAFSMFLFLSLAFMKRVSELIALRQKNQASIEDRGYQSIDLQQLESFGAASGYLSVLVLALYINSMEVSTLYKQPIVLWLISPALLYWISRVWLFTHRGQMHDDPIVFAIKDKASYILALVVLLVLMAAGPR